MARRSFTVIDVTEILVHWHAGRSINEVHESLNVDRKAVLARDWFPGLEDTSLRQTTWPEIGVHHEYTEQLKAGVTKATIHQRLRDEYGLRASLASFKRYLTANLSEEERCEQVVVLRDDVPPGEECICGDPHKHSAPGSCSCGTIPSRTLCCCSRASAMICGRRLRT
jgi:hypothetical protein